MSFVVLHNCQSPGAGAFSRNFTTNLIPQCRAFGRALKNETLKAPLTPGPEGAGDTIDCCIIHSVLLMGHFQTMLTKIIISASHKNLYSTNNLSQKQKII